MDSARFLLVRHAQSTWNAAGRWQGHGDPPLSDLGRDQARALARSLAGEAIDLVVSSDLARALATAEALVSGRKTTRLIVSERLRELDVGGWTGLTRAEIARRDPDLLRAFEAEDPDVRPGGGESRREIRRRVRAAARELAREHAGRSVVVVTHLGAIRALLPGSEPRHAEPLPVTWQALLAQASASASKETGEGRATRSEP